MKLSLVTKCSELENCIHPSTYIDSKLNILL